MTDEEKVARLAGILGIEGAVQYGRFRGYGERSHKRGHREACLSIYNGDGPTDADALRSLVCRLEVAASSAPHVVRETAFSWHRLAREARAREHRARAEAERYESDAAKRDASANAVAAQYAAYLADRGTDGAS